MREMHKNIATADSELDAIKLQVTRIKGSLVSSLDDITTLEQQKQNEKA